MIAAVIGSVNVPVDTLARALDAVAAEGILTLFQTGNVIESPAPGEALACLHDAGAYMVQGALEREVVRYGRKHAAGRTKDQQERWEVLQRAYDALTSEQVEWINRLPRLRQHEIDGVTFALCHGTPGAQQESFLPGAPQARLERIREMAPVDILLCGGSPSMFSRRAGNTLLCGVAGVQAPTGEVQVGIVSTEGPQPVFRVMQL